MNISKTSRVAIISLFLSASIVSFGQDAQANREARFDRNHPRRSQVLDRNANINQKINTDKGHLDGHYRQLKHEDRAIRRQEQRDARRNGGYITKAQQRQLNREENNINRQIKQDQ